MTAIIRQHCHSFAERGELAHWEWASKKKKKYVPKEIEELYVYKSILALYNGLDITLYIYTLITMWIGQIRQYKTGSNSECVHCIITINRIRAKKWETSE